MPYHEASKGACLPYFGVNAIKYTYGVGHAYVHDWGVAN